MIICNAQLHLAPSLIMKSIHKPIKTKPLMKFILVSSSFCAISLCVSVLLLATPKIVEVGSSPQYVSDPTTVDHLVFGIASSGISWPKRKEYSKIWWNWKLNKTIMMVLVLLSVSLKTLRSFSTLTSLVVSDQQSAWHVL